MNGLSVSEFARQAGVNLATVRYYERRRLLPAPPRTPAGYRIYSEESVKRLRFIRHAQELGFTLKEISTLLGISGKRMRSSKEVCDIAREKISAIDARLRDLKSLRKQLFRLTKTCDGNGTVEECVIMRELYS